MAEFDALKKAIERLSKNIAEFPVGAASVNDLKPTAEKIQDLRIAIKRINSVIIMLRAKEAARAMTDVPEESVQDSYDRLQERMVQCAINGQAMETCLYGDAIEPILHNDEDTDMKRTLQDLMQKLFTINDRLINLEMESAKLKEKEVTLTVELKESLLEFKEFLKDQQVIRNRKLKETNPEVADRKAELDTRVRKINVMKRLITNMIAASGLLIERNPFFQEMMKKHRELVDPETIAKMAHRQIKERPQ